MGVTLGALGDNYYLILGFSCLDGALFHQHPALLGLTLIAGDQRRLRRRKRFQPFGRSQQLKAFTRTAYRRPP